MSNLVSKNCVDFVKSFEGFFPEPYYDLVNIKTLGYGMTGSEIEGLTSVTEEQASNMLEDLLNNKYATPIKEDLDSRGVVLKQNEFDALVSMAYNVGTGGVLGSTLYKNICNGIRDVSTITSNFEAWSMAGGKQVYGLLRRRREEAQMFFGNEPSLQSANRLLRLTEPFMYGQDIIELQTKLNKLGYGLGVDGYFGNGTYQAVVKFQQSQGISVDGVVGASTLSTLDSAIAKTQPTTTTPSAPVPTNQEPAIDHAIPVSNAYVSWTGYNGLGYIETVPDKGRINIHLDKYNYLVIQDDPVEGNNVWIQTRTKGSIKLV